MVVRTLDRKLRSYKALKTKAADTPEITALRREDRTENDVVDTSMLAEVAGDRVDILITEDRGIHRKAATLGLAGRVFTIDAFLEKATAENPDLADYKVLSVRKVLFGQVNLQDHFFDSFRADYSDFDRWFNALSKVYISRSIERGLKTGDIIVFYRTADKGAAYYTSVATSLGVVQEVRRVTNTRSEPLPPNQSTRRAR